jgi:hypothetical protein
MRNIKIKLEPSDPMPHSSNYLYLPSPGPDYGIPGAIDPMGRASDESQFQAQQVRRTEGNGEGVDLAQASAICAEEGKSGIFIDNTERPGEAPNSVRINGTMMGSDPGSIGQGSDLVEKPTLNDAEPINLDDSQVSKAVSNQQYYIQSNSNFSNKRQPDEEIKFLPSQNQFMSIPKSFSNEESNTDNYLNTIYSEKIVDATNISIDNGNFENYNENHESFYLANENTPSNWVSSEDLRN